MAGRKIPKRSPVVDGLNQSDGRHFTKTRAFGQDFVGFELLLERAVGINERGEK
jgi:hypothetical protein